MLGAEDTDRQLPRMLLTALRTSPIRRMAVRYGLLRIAHAAFRKWAVALLLAETLARDRRICHETANTHRPATHRVIGHTTSASNERTPSSGCRWETCGRLEADDGSCARSSRWKTGGRPDVVAYDHAADAYVFYDCAPRKPGRLREPVYDRAVGGAQARPRATSSTRPPRWASRFLTEAQYRAPGSWGVRRQDVELDQNARRGALGGALFCDRRFNRVFTFHNRRVLHASRGFRGSLRV
ncbi:MAG: DUF4256 domain-containing protein [Eggerthellaceae bacterium]